MKSRVMTICAALTMMLAMTGAAQALDAKVFVFYEDTEYQGPILGFYSGSYGGPGCDVTYLAGDADWSTYSFSDVDLLWAVPADNFTTAEIGMMASVLSGGGRIGFLGAWYDRERDDSINAAVASLGGHISINTGYVDNGYPHYANRSDGKILSDPFTNNVNSFVYGIFSPLSISDSAKALVLGKDGSSIMLAYENIGAGTVFVMGGQSAWDLDPYSAGTDNRTLFTNMLTVPEPATLVLLAVGAIGLLKRRK